MRHWSTPYTPIVSPIRGILFTNWVCRLIPPGVVFCHNKACSSPPDLKTRLIEQRYPCQNTLLPYIRVPFARAAWFLTIVAGWSASHSGNIARSTFNPIELNISRWKFGNALSRPSARQLLRPVSDMAILRPWVSPINARRRSCGTDEPGDPTTTPSSGRTPAPIKSAINSPRTAARIAFAPRLACP